MQKFQCKNIVIVQLLLLYPSLTQGIDQLSSNEVAVNRAFLTLHGYASNGSRFRDAMIAAVYYSVVIFALESFAAFPLTTNSWVFVMDFVN